jgi:hypothetical protein
VTDHSPPDAVADRGAVLVTFTAGLFVLLAMAALVLDLAAVRVNRAHSLTVTDAAAAAGSLELTNHDGRTACWAASEYVELNLGAPTPFTGVNCDPFPIACDDTTPATVTVGTSDEWTMTILYPVPAGTAMLDPAAIGAGTQALHSGDGHQCDRIGVQLDSEHESVFAGILGTDAMRTEVHSVALATTQEDGDIPLNLLILERYDCDALAAAGSGGGAGGILVDAVINPENGVVEPGFIALDSDGSGSGCGADGTIDVDGSNSEIRADGPEGCTGQIGTHVVAGGYEIGEGCGQIRTFATGTPGCNYPACTSSGTVAPDPTRLLERKTRAPVDHRYNCKASYSFAVGWEIEPCADPEAPHIDDLIAAYGGPGTTPAGFVTWTSLGYSCSVDGPPGTTITVSGNIRVNCPNLSIKRMLVFQGGDVIFDGDVAVTSSGVLAINSDGTQPFPFEGVDPAAIAFFRDGTLSKAGSASLILHRTTGYFAPGGSITMAGGTGALVWTAPTTGVFDDLALWSDSTAVHSLAGQSQLDLEGVFFVPEATVTYQGDGAQRSVQAQFIVRKLGVGGNGRLVVGPAFDRAVLFPTKVAQLIR